MNFTVKEAKVGSTSLCARCISGVAYETDRLDVKTYCRAMKRDVIYLVRRCTGFEERNALSLWDMKEIAWIVKPERKRSAGFIPPKDHSKSPEVVIDPVTKDVEYAEDGD